MPISRNYYSYRFISLKFYAQTPIFKSAPLFKITWEPLYISIIPVSILAGLINVNYFSSFVPIRPYITSRQQIPVVLTNATLVVDLTGNVQYQAFIVCSTTSTNFTCTQDCLYYILAITTNFAYLLYYSFLFSY